MKEHAYFDNAATTWPKPPEVYAFMDSFFRSHGVNPGRSGSLLAAEAADMVSETRLMLAEFFNFSGPAERVIFTNNGTDSLNVAIGGIVSSGDHIITTRLEHNAVLRTANHLERDGGIAVTRVANNAAGYVNASDIESAVMPNTRAIILNHASNVIGTVQPLVEIAAIAKKRGIALIVDAAQTAGVMPIDMKAEGIDILAFPAHKGLFGPMGLGGMIVSESLELNPQRYGGTGVDSQSSFQPERYPYRLEAGTLNIPGIAGLHAAQRWFNELGVRLFKEQKLPVPDDHRSRVVAAMQHVHEAEIDLIERIEKTLGKYRQVTVLGQATRDKRVATLSFIAKDMSTEMIGDRLDADHHIVARSGLQCAPLVHVDADTVDSGGTIRLSPGYFTDEEDTQQLLAALDDIFSEQ